MAQRARPLELDIKKSGGERLTPKENVLPTRNACISTEEGYFPQGVASRARQKEEKRKRRVQLSWTNRPSHT
ncbi:hypothetical protein HNQ85_000470 [Anoxybacillus calidus]|uniref:Uncharacterized protein n=1 Tax=[Anoxybacillus] calidus TaxID=575178 RepID=A0A7V9YXD9_9BACL|nr:hypothetical protein [Anoxybacillus calidus]MBA2870212.1 hypothetical protein [Anoxybacillus calidus]